MKIVISFLLSAFIAFANSFPSNSSLLESKIVTGDILTERKNMYYVSIRYGEQHFCGGSLITYDHVLTAGYCTRIVLISRSSIPGFTILAGTNSRMSHRGVVCGISEAESHSDYDIGIILLAESVPHVVLITPLNLPKKHTPDSEEFSVVGWGAERIVHPNEINYPLAEFIKKMPVVIIQQSICKIVHTEINYFTHMCGIGKYVHGQLSEGDTGNGLTFDDEIIGIATHGTFVPVHENTPLVSVYIRVSSFIPYITDAVTRLNELALQHRNRKENVYSLPTDQHGNHLGLQPGYEHEYHHPNQPGHQGTFSHPHSPGNSHGYQNSHSLGNSHGYQDSHSPGYLYRNIPGHPGAGGSNSQGHIHY